MPQSLTQLPKTADFKIGGRWIVIDDHEVVSGDGLFSGIIYYVNSPYFDGQILYEFEKHGISFEMAIEECVRELEPDIKTFARVIRDNGIYASIISDNDIYTSMMTDYRPDWNSRRDFTKSLGGRKIASQLIEKIRSCGNWGELYAELQHTSKFSKDMKNKIKEEIIQWCKV